MKYCIFLLRTLDNFFGVFREQTLHLKKKSFEAIRGIHFEMILVEAVTLFTREWADSSQILFKKKKSPL